MAAKAARKLSQVITHMTIGFAITYAVTGSLVAGGLAVVLEPVINVLLVPFHERAWKAIEHTTRYARGVLVAAEKTSLAVLHFIVAFSVMYAVTGSLAFGGLAAVLEPICNVILMPLHDRFWDSLRAPAQAA
jgi:uncharacterized membrane protein